MESSTATLKTFLEDDVDWVALLAAGMAWLFMVAIEGQTFAAALGLAYRNIARTGSMPAGGTTARLVDDIRKWLTLRYSQGSPQPLKVGQNGKKVAARES